MKTDFDHAKRLMQAKTIVQEAVQIQTKDLQAQLKAAQQQMSQLGSGFFFSERRQNRKLQISFRDPYGLVLFGASGPALERDAS